MIALISTWMLLTASVGNVTPPPRCRIESIEYELDDNPEVPPLSVSQVNYVYITIKTSPEDEQRSLNGNGALYYQYYDSLDRLQKAVEFFSFIDSVPAGTEETEISQRINVIGEMDKVYDMKMSALTCAID